MMDRPQSERPDPGEPDDLRLPQRDLQPAGKDADIDKVIQSIKAAGKVGLPVVEYNWYAHRAMEGYFEETGRAGAGWTGFDYAAA